MQSLRIDVKCVFHRKHSIPLLSLCCSVTPDMAKSHPYIHHGPHILKLPQNGQGIGCFATVQMHHKIIIIYHKLSQ